ncbi:diguanylate cyclase, partial [Pseudomonas sp. PA-3-6H]|uniref:diguanylate cyclase n=1 Tax=Pseudomonas sp. PA-3-6H TaxID=2665475 RepID=UPI001F3E97E5
ILPATDSTGAAVVAQRILSRLQQENITHPGSPFGRVSVSIGVATGMGSRLESVLGLVEAADAALYGAKAAGRNGFNVHPAHVTSSG